MTRQEIVEEARTARAAFLTIIESIEAEIARIKDKEWTSPLSKADRDKLKELRSDKAEVMLAVEELGYVTMGALDKSDGIQRIKNALTGARRDLAADRERLEKLAETPQQFADILAKLKKIVDKVSERLAG